MRGVPWPGCQWRLASSTRAVFLAFLLTAGVAAPLWAQGTQADYDRAAQLHRTIENKVFRDRVEPNWFDEGRQFWYRLRTGPDRHEFVLVHAEQGRREPAFDHGRLAAALVKAGEKDVRADALPIEQLELSTAEPAMDFRSRGKWWRCDLKTYALREWPRGNKDSAPGRGRLQSATGGPRASTHTGEETHLTFVNRTRHDVRLYWLDEEGRRHRYGTLKPGDAHEQHTFAGHVWLFVGPKGQALGVVEADESHAMIDIGDEAPPPAPEPLPGEKNRSPDGRWQAFVKDHNLWLRQIGNLPHDTSKIPVPEEFALSTDGTADDSYGDAIFWSPDSRKVAALRTRPGQQRKIYIVESSPKNEIQPRPHIIDYEKPGDRIAVWKPQLFDVAARRQIFVSDMLMPNPWSITELRWTPDSRRFMLLYNQRGHQVMRLLAVDAATGAVRTIINEQSPTFIDYSGKYFLQMLDASNEMIWMSERDGWNHLYLYDSEAARLKNQVTKGPWVVREVRAVDEKNRQIWFMAGGIRPGQDPYYAHLCRVGFDGSGLLVVTEGDGNHITSFSPDRRYVIDTYSRVDMPPVTELRRSADGRLLCELERADTRALFAAGWRPPEPMVAKGRDGLTDIYGLIFRPSNFDPKKKYPVIEDIYAGPQSFFVPKSFHPFSKCQEMAELGFIVVKIDGMGTSGRSKRFHDVCWKNLADAGLPDRIAWIKAAAAKYPQVDLSRVGIYGGSAGGQNAACAVMTHGDFYKVAVADCGCHDNRVDKLWWNEQWMGWPIGPQYAACSNVTLAPRLQGKLLLIVGEMDTNVDPASTMQVVNALVKADKDFDLLVIPGAGHGAAETPYGSRRRADYFVRNLLGVEPRAGSIKASAPPDGRVESPGPRDREAWRTGRRPTARGR
jgi:dipeptidyl aminopeptidase/acylaminoacyl peptidase